ncbi:DNA-binding protein [Bacillus sp. JK74]
MAKFIFESIEELRDFMDKEVISTSEAIEIIGCSQQNLKHWLIKTTNRDRLFLRRYLDIEGYQKKR